MAPHDLRPVLVSYIGYRREFLVSADQERGDINRARREPLRVLNREPVYARMVRLRPASAIRKAANMSGATSVKDKVQRYLLDMGLNGIELTPTGGLTFRLGSSRVFIDVYERQLKEDETNSIVSFYAPMVVNAQPSN